MAALKQPDFRQKSGWVGAVPSTEFPSVAALKPVGGRLADGDAGGHRAFHGVPLRGRIEASPTQPPPRWEEELVRLATTPPWLH